MGFTDLLILVSSKRKWSHRLAKGNWWTTAIAGAAYSGKSLDHNSTWNWKLGYVK